MPNFILVPIPVDTKIDTFKEWAEKDNIIVQSLTQVSDTVGDLDVFQGKTISKFVQDENANTIAMALALSLALGS